MLMGMDIVRAWHRTVTSVTPEKEIGAVGPGHSPGYSSVKRFLAKVSTKQERKILFQPLFYFYDIKREPF